MSDYPPPTGGRPWSAGSTRELTISASTARTAVLQAIRALGFTTSSEQFSLVVAERGSRLRGLSMTRIRMPVRLRVMITPQGAGCTLDVRLEDRWVGTAANKGVVTLYADLFTEVLSGLDDRLKQADPKAAASFGAWWRQLPEAAVAAGAGSAASAARLEKVASRGASRLLEGPRKGPTSAAAAAGVTMVSFVSPVGVAHVPADVVDGMLTAGRLVASAPGEMPPRLVEQVQAMLLLLEERLLGLSDARGGVTVEVAEADQPVITFLYQQAALRERLPVRLLMTCTTCRLEKIVNPDFVKLRERNRRAKVLTSSVGAAFGTHHISPFILVGRFAQLKNSDPDFVCQRCQGIDADEKPITFCPRCGDRRGESVLRVCPNCTLDLRTLLTNKTVWQELEATPEPAAGVWTPPQVPPSGEAWAPPQPSGEVWAPPQPSGEVWAPPQPAGDAWA